MAPTCDFCETAIPSGEVVTLDGSVLCVPCGFTRAALLLEDFLAPGYSPLELRAHEYGEAFRVMDALRARILCRLAEVGAMDLTTGRVMA